MKDRSSNTWQGGYVHFSVPEVLAVFAVCRWSDVLNFVCSKRLGGSHGVVLHAVLNVGDSVTSDSFEVLHRDRWRQSSGGTMMKQSEQTACSMRQHLARTQKLHDFRMQGECCRQ